MIRGFLSTVKGMALVVIVLAFIVLPSTGAVNDQSNMLITTNVSEVNIVAADAVLAIGFKVNGVEYTHPVYIVQGGDVIVVLNHLPYGKQLHPVVEGNAAQVLTDRSIHLYDIRSEIVTVTLSFGTPSIPENPTPTPTPSEPDTPSPSEPVRPDVPDTPGTPDTPGADTPGSDEPGSDKPGSDEPGLDEPGSDGPFVPILPPAGSVYNIAGTIPLAAGFLLLFLLVFWRRKVYRILKAHAKKHGEKPERKQLKATADAIIQIIRDEEKYPKWRKNSELTTRLSADIISVLDEMQYPPQIPRGAVAADIIKSAKGRINRHRL